jgi:Domain of unknown function (DUF6285)
VQYRPDATELLADVAALLDDEVLGAVSGPLQHRVRVAANLVRIVEREVRSGAANDAAERARLVELLGPSDGDLVELRRRLAARLDDPAPLEAGLSAAIHTALLATVRADLAISKPAYDAWDGE